MSKATIADIRKAILKELPKDGTQVGNKRMRELVEARLEANVHEDDYFEAREALIGEGKARAGRGRGGAVARIVDDAPALELQSQEVPEEAKRAKPRQATMPLTGRKTGQPAKAKNVAAGAEKVIAYHHDDKRINNPEVGMVSPDTDPAQPRTRWAYDPHIDPALQFDMGRAQVESLIDDALASGDEVVMRDALSQLKRQTAPYLNWTGKAERTSFEVDTVSLHVHERIDPASILAAVRKRLKQGREGAPQQQDWLRAWFEQPLAYRDALEFYKHDRGWANRLIAGDSLQVMNSLLNKEGMAGQVQMIYIDPPYGIKYGSNFQPFVNKRDVKDRKDEDLTQEPEMIKAFRDTWELGIHSYLTYLRDRLLMAKELLHESGSVFVQISDENVHYVRELCDEVLDPKNFAGQIQFVKTSGAGSPNIGTNVLASVSDYLVWYAKDLASLKYRQLHDQKGALSGDLGPYCNLRDKNGGAKRLSKSEREGIDLKAAIRSLFRLSDLTSQTAVDASTFDIEIAGTVFAPKKGGWKTSNTGMHRLQRANRVQLAGSTPSYVRYLADFVVQPINNTWTDTGVAGFATDKVYAVQTDPKVIERCILMTTDPGDLVLDPTCGSGTTAFVAEKWGRRWITCDTSRVAVTLAKQRLMTASYDYYELKYPHEGLKAGFIYKTVPHVTLKSIANNPEIDEIWARMHPTIEQALADLNTALVGAARGSDPVAFIITEGGRKGETIKFGAGNRIRTLPSGDKVPDNALLEWEVPFDFPQNWPAEARAAFDAFHAACQAMQARMDASIDAHADQETLYDQPEKSRDKLRITGPFTVEAVPFPSVLALDAADRPLPEADTSIARTGESARQHQWRDELLKTGIRGKGGQMLRFAALEALPSADGFRHLHCTGSLAESGERVVVSFGPEHAALEQRQVEMAFREAETLFPLPKFVVFCAFAFDPEAAKDIDAKKGVTALKVQMNTDLLTEDLKKNRASNQSFWLMGQPEVTVEKLKDDRYRVEVHGFDYFDTKTGELKSGGKGKIAAWMLDTDYDERSLFPRQVFFPMAGKKDGWNKLKKDIKAELDERLLEKLHSTVSLPFEAGEHRKVAVKIVDDRGIESLKIIALD